jgi:hypothetical protein
MVVKTDSESSSAAGFDTNMLNIRDLFGRTTYTSSNMSYRKNARNNEHRS